ncbi:MAG TPA: chemotaxis protein CheW [Beijerinckiaceae bacterium]|nr:chemotaxis protein CheW [Beijerinckiaceae bacterium]
MFTLVVDGEIFGLPVACVHTIFRATAVTVVPLGPREVVGLVNLRGNIVTAVSLRRRLGLEDDEAREGALAIGIEHEGETFALFVDELGDVITVSEDFLIPAPPHFSPARLEITAAVYRLESRILPVLDLAAILRFTPYAREAA